MRNAGDLSRLTARHVFFAGWGVATLCVQLPIVKMIVDDPQTLYLGAWDGSTFGLFLFVTFFVVPVALGGIFSSIYLLFPPLSVFLVASVTSFLVVMGINFHYLQLYYIEASWRRPVVVGGFLLLIVLIWLFRHFVVRLLGVCGAFSVGILALFVYQAAPFRMADVSATLPAKQIARNEHPVFFLTFEKLVASYLMDADGRILEDRVPNLARFVSSADLYVNAYANTTATVYSLKTLYSGRLQSAERNWTRHANLRDIVGGNRRVFMFLDILPDYCRAPRDTCVRPFAEGIQGRDLIVGWYKSYVKSILPDRLEGRLALRGWRFDPRMDLWVRAQRGLKAGESLSVHIGVRQFRDLSDVIQREGNAPHLYIMHSFISDGPGTKTSALQGRNESDYLQDLAWARENLATFDQHVGGFLDALKKFDVYDRSLIVIASDTGYDPASRNVKADKKELPASPEMLRIFTAIKRPGQKQGRVIPAVFRQIDVLPTILKHMGIDSGPYGFEGVPVTDPEDRTSLAQRPLHFVLTSEVAGLLHYRLTDPAGPLVRCVGQC